MLNECGHAKNLKGAGENVELEHACFMGISTHTYKTVYLASWLDKHVMQLMILHCLPGEDSGVHGASSRPLHWLYIVSSHILKLFNHVQETSSFFYFSDQCRCGLQTSPCSADMFKMSSTTSRYKHGKCTEAHTVRY